jgi:hypothetical protein
MTRADSLLNEDFRINHKIKTRLNSVFVIDEYRSLLNTDTSQ